MIQKIKLNVRNPWFVLAVFVAILLTGGLSIDARAADSDNDGLDDTLELSSQLNPYNPDTDGDGMPDPWEFAYNPNRGHIYDPDEDPDQDYLSNLYEYYFGSLPHNADADQDNVLDGLEYAYNMNPYSADSDNDGLSDYDEFGYSTSQTNPDTDSDGISDYDEVMVWGSYGYLADSDQDYLSDWLELLYWATPVSSATGWGDDDEDTFSNSDEAGSGHDPLDPNDHP